MPTKTYREIGDDVLREFTAAVLTIMSIYGVRLLVAHTIGSERLWGIVPLKYCVDTVDFVVLCKFLWNMLKTFNE